MNFFKKIFSELYSDNGSGKWTIGKRIMMLGLGGAAITLILGLVAIGSLYMINNNTHSLVEINLPELEISTELQMEIREIAFSIRNYSENYDEEHWLSAESRFSRIDEEIERANQLVKDHRLIDLGNRMVDIERAARDYRVSAYEFYQASLELVESRNQADASNQDFQFSMQDYTETARENLSGLINRNAGAAQVESARDRIGRVDQLMLGISSVIGELWRAEALNNVDVLQDIETRFGEYRSELGSIYDDTSDPELQMFLGIGLASLNDNVRNVRTMIAARNLVYEQEQIRSAAYDEIIYNASTLAELAQEQAMLQGELTQGVVTKFIWTLSLGVLIAVVCAVIFGLFMSRSINSILHDIINRLTAGAEQVDASSNQLTESSQELAESASEQAASLQQTTSSLEEIASQTKQTAENASEANLAMKETEPRVLSGVEAMERMSETMQEIKKSSLETSRIIETIDDIAFQTNLLALNAAVEAARAGEAGKGFAVVAEEVRNLAQRSAEAARNTSELIESSQATSERGTNVAAEVSENLRKIEESVSSVGLLVDEIAAAANEQQTGIQEMSTAMHQMDKVVQGNASNSEESASAAEELSSQSTELNNIVNTLKSLVGGRKNTTLTSSPQHPHSPSLTSIPFKDEDEDTGEGTLNRSRKSKKQGDISSKRTNAHSLIPLNDKDLNGF